MRVPICSHVATVSCDNIARKCFRVSHVAVHEVTEEGTCVDRRIATYNLLGGYASYIYMNFCGARYKTDYLPFSNASKTYSNRNRHYG